MTRTEFKKNIPALSVLVGTVISHLFFTWMVYRENLSLHDKMQLVIDAGYLPVPNAHILPALTQLGTAFKGAFFYTLTAGIALPFLVCLAAWAWDRGYRRNRAFLIMLSGFVIFCMLMLNRHGFNSVITLWFLAVYITVFKLTLYGLENVETRFSKRHLLAHIVVLTVLGAAWITAPGGTDFFLSVRDHLLLSNPIGVRITTFYYRYSPSPTNAYQELVKKQIKTCAVEWKKANKIQQRHLEAALLRYDYLPVDPPAKTDISIRILDDRVSYSVAGRKVLQTTVDALLQSPGEVLSRVSARSDRNDFTRRFLAVSLFYALPVFLYACLFSIFRFCFNRLPASLPAFWLSAAGCIVVGIAALICFKVIADPSIPADELKNAISSESRDTRVAALRTISRLKLDPYDYMDGDLKMDQMSVPERIWWTISLGNSASPGTNELLIGLLDDPHPLVACKAYIALAKRKYRAAVPVIIDKLGTSRHWYVQVEAYNALRNLGWIQAASN